MNDSTLAFDTTIAAPLISRRLLSLSAAAALCVALGYLAVTQSFNVITDLIDDGAVVTAEVERPRTPPVAPAVERPPLTPQRTAEPDPTAPPTETPDVVSFEPPPIAQTGPSLLINASFLERPSGRDFERYFPHRAVTRGVSGRVVLDCAVAADGRLSCAVASEDPAGWGFGDASLQAARHFRVAPATADGQPTSGGRLRVPMAWRAE